MGDPLIDWWIGLAPAQASVECGGHSHRLEWSAGAFRALDHDDPDGERMLAALGGGRCACIDLLDAWERHRDDLRVLTLARRGPADRLIPQADQASLAGRNQAAFQQLQARRARSGRPRVLRGSSASGAGFIGLVGGGPAGSAQPERLTGTERANRELVALMGLPGGIPDRLLATVAATWRTRIANRDGTVARARPQLQAALYGRVLTSIHAWLGDERAVAVELRMLGDRGRPTLHRDGESFVAELSFGWLCDVWIRNLATIWGRFCLDASSPDAGRTWQLRTVRPDRAGESSVTLSLGPM